MLPDPKPQLPLPTRRWLTPDEAAAYLAISRGQFDYNVRSGLITPSRAVGKRIPRYDVADLDVMMEAGKRGHDGDSQGVH